MLTYLYSWGTLKDKYRRHWKLVQPFTRNVNCNNQHKKNVMLIKTKSRQRKWQLGLHDHKTTEISSNKKIDGGKYMRNFYVRTNPRRVLCSLRKRADIENYNWVFMTSRHHWQTTKVSLNKRIDEGKQVHEKFQCKNQHKKSAERENSIWIFMTSRHQ